MKGQPCLAAGYPEPYAATADTYDRLVGWAVERWGETPRPRMAAFLREVWSDRSTPVADVLEICCGTGLMLEQLLLNGYRVTGLDRSAAMLQQAGDRLGTRVPLVQAELPDIPLGQRFDAVVCAAAALNYMPDQQTLARTFAAVAERLHEGGSFVFDLLSRRKLETEFAQSWAGELDDLAFIWQFEHDPAGRFSDLTYTQFLRDSRSADVYRATRELHRLYVLDRDMVRESAAAAGFRDIQVFDNYTSRPADHATENETWVLTRA